MSPKGAEVSADIRGVLIPLAGDQLLMPNSLVAEVVNYQAPQPVADAPAWLKGHMGWRGEILPVVSMEVLMQIREGQLGHRARIVVCNALSGNPRLPYLGLVAQSIPRLIRITRDNLEPGDEARFRVPGSIAGVRIAGEEASIPDLDALERALLQQMSG